MFTGLFRFVYSICLICSWPFLYIHYTLQARRGSKYRANYRSRLGLDCPPELPRSARIWVHALSVGETLSAAPLVRTLKRRFPQCEIVFSTATESGQEIARKGLARWVSHFCYLPHDFPWAVHTAIRRVKPSLFILIETDIWPNLLCGLERRHVPSVLVNGRISPRSFERMLAARPLMEYILSRFTLICAQSAEDRKRYIALGAPPERVHAEGNLKFDSSAPELPQSMFTQLREQTGIQCDRPVWIGGSTHEGEEELLLHIHKTLRRQNPDLLLVLAPRHVSRASEIASLCSRLGFGAVLRSTGALAAGSAVYIVDTLGELKSFYALAQIAFIGGSMAPFGGHNPLEAVAQGKPAIWGPHLFNFREIERNLIEAGCGLRVASEAELRSGISEWLAQPGILKDMEANARRFFSLHEGCSARIASKLAALKLIPAASASLTLTSLPAQCSGCRERI